MAANDLPVTIGAASKHVRRHPSTLRRVERAGLITPRRTWSGRRLYDAVDLRRLRDLFGLSEADGDADSTQLGRGRA